jgi:hypothetical protein
LILGHNHAGEQAKRQNANRNSGSHVDLAKRIGTALTKLYGGRIA